MPELPENIKRHFLVNAEVSPKPRCKPTLFKFALGARGGLNFESVRPIGAR
jgi:hypothetical protein